MKIRLRNVLVDLIFDRFRIVNNIFFILENLAKADYNIITIIYSTKDNFDKNY